MVRIPAVDVEGLHVLLLRWLGLLDGRGLGLGDGLGVGIAGGGGRVVSLDSRIGASKDRWTKERPGRGEEARSRTQSSHDGQMGYDGKLKSRGIAQGW